MPKKEIKVPNFQSIYRVVEIIDGIAHPTGQFRVRRRFCQDGRWTTHTKTVGSFEEAKRLAKQPFLPRAVHTVDTAALTFKEAFEKFLRHKEYERKLAKGTIDGYRNRYKHLIFFEPMKMSAIGPKTLDGWIDLLLDPEYLKAQQGSRICYEHEFKLVTTFFRYYRNFVDESFLVPVLDRHRQRACARPKSSEPEIRFLSADEEARFLVQLGRWPAIRDLAIFQLHTGARIGEAAAMEFRNVDFSRDEVRLQQHLHWERHKDGRIMVMPGTKTGPPRNVPLTGDCRAMIQRRQREARSSIVFADKSASWLRYRSIQSIYDRAFKRAGLPHSGTHVLRHTFAVRFLDQTKDIYALQKLLGHTDLKVTQVYAKYSNEAVRRAFQLFRVGMNDETTAHVPQLVPQTVS